MENEIILGDNLGSLRRLDSSTIDLVYLDPPYNSGRNYNHKSVGEAKVAYTDTWKWGREAEASLSDSVSRYSESTAKLAVDFLLSSRSMLPESTLAYLTMLTPRLIELHRVLKTSGSIYVHVDPSASHYVKVVLDIIFNSSNFRAEIIWRRTSAHNNAKRPGPVHDVILFYSKSKEYTWNPIYHEYNKDYPKVYDGHDSGRMWVKQSLTGHGTRNGDSGQIWNGFDPTSAGRHWSISKQLRVEYYNSTKEELTGSILEQLNKLLGAGLILPPKKEGSLPYAKHYINPKGPPLQDIWLDIAPAGSRSEYSGFEGQKPVELLERIIQASSHPGDVVLDPFLGSGTTVVAAQKLGRKWIGFEANEATWDLAKKRLASDNRVSLAPKSREESFYQEQESLRVQELLLDVALSTE